MREGRVLDKTGDRVTGILDGAAGTVAGAEERVVLVEDLTEYREGRACKICSEGQAVREREATAFLTESSSVQTEVGREREQFWSERNNALRQFSRQFILVEIVEEVTTDNLIQSGQTKG